MRRWVVLGVVGVAALGVGAVLLFRGSEPEVTLPPVEEFLREETLLTAFREADLDGDGVPEVVVASRSKLFAHFELPSQYLDVYAHRDGAWRVILEGTVEAPDGRGSPKTMLDTPAVDRISRLVDSVRVVDFEGDGSPELVAGILTVGAGAGPLELWVASLEPGGDFRTEYYFRTTRGGEVHVDGDRLVFEFPVYRPDDPGCCPSRIERQVIGFDAAAGSIGVLERDRRKVS